MKLKRNTIMLAVAVGLIVLAGNIAVAAKNKWIQAKSAEAVVATAKVSADAAAAREQAVLRLLPAGPQGFKPAPIREVTAVGVIRLMNLARDNGIAVSSISPESQVGGQAGAAIDQIAGSVPMTDGALKRIPIKISVRFKDLESLSGFVASIPKSGGYLSEIKIGKSTSDLSIRFIGA